MEESKQGRDAQTVQQSVQKGLHSPHHIPLSLVVVGTETALFDETSKVRERILAYTEPFKEVSIIVLCGPKFTPAHTGNVSIYPTNSRSRIMRFFDGIRIGRSLPHADVVTVQDPFETGLVGWFIARRLRAPLHVQVHTDFLSPAYAKLSALNRLRVYIAGFVLRRAARIRVVSLRIKKSIEAKYRLHPPISVLPIFVDLERFRTAQPDPSLPERFSKFSKRLLVVARLEREKNQTLAVRAFSEAFKSRHDVCLIIVGEGSMRGSLEQLVSSLGESGRIFFEGAQDPVPYYAMADLVIVTSEYEGYGLTIIEALAAGKPVISTEVGVAPEVDVILSSSEDFSEMLRAWIEQGPRFASLGNYPYKNFDEYVQAYCDDITSCVEAQKGHTTAL